MSYVLYVEVKLNPECGISDWKGIELEFLTDAQNAPFECTDLIAAWYPLIDYWNFALKKRY